MFSEKSLRNIVKTSKGDYTLELDVKKLYLGHVDIFKLTLVDVDEIDKFKVVDFMFFHIYDIKTNKNFRVIFREAAIKNNNIEAILLKDEFLLNYFDYQTIDNLLKNGYKIKNAKKIYGEYDYVFVNNVGTDHFDEVYIKLYI